MHGSTSPVNDDREVNFTWDLNKVKIKSKSQISGSKYIAVQHKLNNRHQCVLSTGYITDESEGSLVNSTK